LNKLDELRISSTCAIFSTVDDSVIALSVARQALERYAQRPVRQQTEPALHGADAIFRVNGQRFIVEVKSNARSASVASAITQLQEVRKEFPDAFPLLVIPNMGDTGAEICQREGVNWIDLRGNATIDTDELRIYVRGKDDAVVESDAASSSSVNPFGPRASRVVHALLLYPNSGLRRAQIETITVLDKGYVSKIIAALIEGKYVEEIKIGRLRELRVNDPLLLLDAWRERYKRPKVKAWGLVAAHNGPEAVSKVDDVLKAARHDRAFTGLSSAAVYSKFGSFRRVDVYVQGLLSDEVLSKLQVGSDERGRNVVLYGDSLGAFIGREDKGGLPVASPILTYLDLAKSGERSDEAAEEMRRYLVKQWK
jgi:hypothetical protein